MQAPGFCAALVPALKKFYPNKEDKPHYIEALKRNMTFFNTKGMWPAFRSERRKGQGQRV